MHHAAPYPSSVCSHWELCHHCCASSRTSAKISCETAPDQYTYIPASLKILKVLVSELLAAAGSSADLAAAAAADLAEDASDDGDWEDDPNPLLDLGTGMTKEQLMAFANESVGSGFGPASRQRDDETQGYLVGWFQEKATMPGFDQEFARLDPEEQEKLRGMS
jgi:hypothetical protein